jgi:F-type H+-transporting ATPase subunit delta
MALIGGSSRQSLASLRSSLDGALTGLSSKESSALSADLFTALAALQSSVGLRRALTDPARDASSKAQLVSELFGKSVSSHAVSVLGAAAGLRWSSPADIATAVEQIAVESEVASANGDGSLDRAEDELFAFSRLLIQENELRQALNSPQTPVANKVEIVKALFAAKYAPATLSLLTHLVQNLAGRSIESALESFSSAFQARRNRTVALVRSTVALSEAQRARLTEVLTKQAGQPVHINVEIDPSLVGGLAVRFADELIDGSISTRLANARRAVAL